MTLQLFLWSELSLIVVVVVSGKHPENSNKEVVSDTAYTSNCPIGYNFINGKSFLTSLVHDIMRRISL